MGEYGTLYIQAKDAFGNNQIVGGDAFKVIFTLNTDPAVQVRGTIDDHSDGTYTVRYTIPVAGEYDVAVTLASSDTVEESILTCVAAYSPFVYARYYDGVNHYVEPSFCTLDHPTLTVVHNDLSPAMSTYNDLPGETLAFAEVGLMNEFTIEARDVFGNLRMGDNTTHFYGYGNGESDYFLVEFTQPETNDYYRRSSAIDHVVIRSLPFGTTGFFRLSFGGRTTPDIPESVSESTLEAILERLHDYQLDVVVSKEIEHGAIMTITWKVEFLTMLNVWQSMPPSGPATGAQLTLVPPTGYVASDALYDRMVIERPAHRGIYPVSFTLWQTGTYTVRITNNGMDIQGSPATIFVKNAPVDPTSSIAYGKGLVGGIAGEQLTVTIQAKDTRQPAIQYITTMASVVPYVGEIQQVTLPSSGAFTLSFRGRTTSSLTIGTSTYATLTSALSALNTMGTFSVLTTSGGAITAGTLGASASFWVSFTGPSTPPLVGPLPAISGSAGVVVSKVRVGDAPYRKEVQVVKCYSASTVTATLTLGDRTMSFQTDATLASMQSRMSSELNVGSITLTNPDSAATNFCGSGYSVFVQFNDVRGPAAVMTTTSSAVTVSTLATDGALSGIFPLWGTFTIGAHGENTTTLPFDATPQAVKDALMALYSIGEVHVTKDTYGRPFRADGTSAVYTTAAANHIYSVWTINFDGACKDNVDGVASNKCPTSLVDEPLLYVNTENILHLSLIHI